ncbi:MAG TPA: dihydrofolate reductase family protein [Rhizomicrobium sp.]|jgi:dihydrofolate reductase|nr:dihydrofolate reductase family protein [Rhizomicrobium sp.]
MRKLISLMHVSLDGFCAGPKGEMDWISMNSTIFADATNVIDQAGAAVYGRTVHDMMKSYWPTFLGKPDSPEVRHAHWVEQIPKLTFSRSMMSSDWNNVQLRREAKEIFADKEQPGKDLLIFGSPSLVHAFLELDAIDEFWIFQNPVLLGSGIAYFKGAARNRLKLLSHKPFDNGVIRLRYAKETA